MPFDAKPTLPVNAAASDEGPINPMILGRLHQPEQDSPTLEMATDDRHDPGRWAEYGSAIVYKQRHD